MANRIGTRPGDAGQTRLASGLLVDKDSPTIETLGVLDELNASIAVVQAVSAFPEQHAILARVRAVIQEIGNLIAAGRSAVLSPKEVEELEVQIRNVRVTSESQPHAVPPVGSLSAAFSEVARAQCRRAERRLLTLSELPFSAPGLGDYPIDRPQFQHALRYLNRLSDFLALTATVADASGGELSKH
ncbi:ATP:cob(I)alamin adenosyltransferase [Allomesorhizobium alhagi]|uniref:Corrinoid adenosyltransferase n=1 Tax=Mesorhizobium alhagi CCNWXJ12-2 TaxID=1107882 RepID=H0HWV7_9HYPH|nr:ATP:cob(I)alamin adenosyltransferase [Mesorhizobium alhagi]EHK54802.1 ATP/cobalamin adenosyltransferase [Mesorhizobium alhagi CCNWXJ12-2]